MTNANRHILTVVIYLGQASCSQQISRIPQSQPQQQPQAPSVIQSPAEQRINPPVAQLPQKQETIVQKTLEPVIVNCNNGQTTDSQITQSTPIVSTASTTTSELRQLRRNPTRGKSRDNCRFIGMLYIVSEMF